MQTVWDRIDFDLKERLRSSNILQDLRAVQGDKLESSAMYSCEHLPHSDH